MKTIETQRLSLRPWRDEDCIPFAQMNADERVMQHMPALLDEDESNHLAQLIRAGESTRDWGLWAVEVRGGAPFIGFVGLAVPVFEGHFTPAVEIGWRLAFEAWGQGYATEAALAAVDFGFTDAGLDEIVSFTSHENLRSIAVMKRLGMTSDPRDDFEHPRVPEGHRLRAHLLYRLSRAQWQRRR